MFTLSRARTWCALTLSLSLSGLTHATFTTAFTQVISFGDSLSDVGNVYAASGGTFPPPPYFEGRFSDGLVWTEILATGLGLSPATPSLLGGGNYAWGGARTTVGTEINTGPNGEPNQPPSLSEQVQLHTAGAQGVAVDPFALYTVLIGGNDINAFDGTSYGTAELEADAQAVAGIVQNLMTAGAENILVANVPDLGGTPACDGNEANCTGLTNLYNGNLFGALATLDQSKLFYLDLFTLGQDIIAGSPKNGFTDVDNNCLETNNGKPCDGFLFFDDLHPTEEAHALIGQAAVAAVPVPAALPLMLSALLGLGAIKRARQA